LWVYICTVTNTPLPAIHACGNIAAEAVQQRSYTYAISCSMSASAASDHPGRQDGLPVCLEYYVYTLIYEYKYMFNISLC